MHTVWICLFLIATSILARGEESQISVKDLASAKKIYAAKCGRCHEFYPPRDYADAEWNVWMAKMIRKSRLKKEQAELLTRYTDRLRAPSKSIPRPLP